MTSSFSVYEDLLQADSDPSERTTYSYYRKFYTNPSVGDIVELTHYSDDYNSLCLVITIVKDGLYKVIPVRQYGFEDTQYNAHGKIMSRTQLYIPDNATLSLLDMKAQRKQSKYTDLNIFDL